VIFPANLALVPRMTDVHAEDAAVVVHQRVEAEPRHAQQGASRSQPSAAAHSGRRPKYDDPPVGAR
jgi:hypothetical protein